MSQSPQLVVLAGPNGAGKPTASKTIIRGTLNIMEFVNADVIAQGISAFTPEAAALAAGRIMLERLHELASLRRDFVFETTLASKAFAPWIRVLPSEGYFFRLVFLWLPSPDSAVQRVRQRVQTGGHHVDQETILRRYRSGLHNCFRIYWPIADDWRVHNNAVGRRPRMIAAGKRTRVTRIVDAAIWASIQQEHGHE